jgi:regulator of RNase E activity RraA
LEEKQTVKESDENLFRTMREKLFSAVISDALDELGYLHQFLPPEIRPVRDNMIVAGRAMTVLHQDSPGAEVPGNSQPTLGLMLKALDDLRSNEVYVASGSSAAYALFGEHMAIRAKRLGCVGAVVDGYSRDTNGIRELNFPTFSRGWYGLDQRPRGRVIEFRVPMRIGEVQVAPGDIVFGDIDGVVVIPKKLEAQVLENAMERIDREHKVRETLKSGSLSTTAIVEKFGLL